MPKEISLTQRRKSRAKNRSLSFVTAVFFLFVLLYMIQLLIVSAKKSNVATETVKIGSVDLPRIVEGVVIRDEKVYKSTASGVVSFQVTDNVRVKKGAVVCAIQDEAAVSQIKQSIAQVDESLIKRQEQRASFALYTDKENKINHQIKNIVDNSIYRFSTMDVQSVYILKEMIVQNVSVRNQMIVTEDNGSLRELAAQRQSYQNQLSGSMTLMAAENSGVVSFRIDGQEETFTPENMPQIQKKQMAKYNILSAPVRDADVDTPVFKIVQSNIWYIGAYISNDLIKDYSAGDETVIYIEDQDKFIPLPVRIHSVVPGAKEAYVLYQSTKNMLEYLDVRSIRFITVNSVQTGYKISSTALADKVEDDLPVKGVYRVNNGTAEFRRVTLPDDAASGNGYIILDPRVNKNIQAFDKIVTDASKVKENQTIFS